MPINEAQKADFETFKAKATEIALKVCDVLDGQNSKECIFALHQVTCFLLSNPTATTEERYNMCTLLITFLEREREAYGWDKTVNPDKEMPN